MTWADEKQILGKHGTGPCGGLVAQVVYGLALHSIGDLASLVM